MRQSLLPIFTLLFLSLSCTKNNDDFVTGRVEVKGGCFADSWLVSIDNPDPDKYSFLRATVLSGTAFNCSNAVFINLPSSLGTTGTRIRFKYISTEVSCLSSSEAPNHIMVKNLARR
ncbi:hypothetical protein [Terrimonas alba]|uniref:hypothetical protein n=1 Tax=Terrimonas alba TaxID=3349636 RepID=UPI0035F4BE7F